MVFLEQVCIKIRQIHEKIVLDGKKLKVVQLFNNKIPIASQII